MAARPPRQTCSPSAPSTIGSCTGGFTIELDEAGEPFSLAPDRRHPPHADAPVPADPSAALEAMHAELGIDEETVLTGWDGMPIDYGACVGVVCAADEEQDLHLSVGAWLVEHEGGIASA